MNNNIRADQISFIYIDEIKINPNNRNKHTSEQIKRLCQIIDYQGFRSPLVISNQSGLLVAGHGRLLAAKKLGYEKLPVIYQDFDSMEQEYAAGVSDNSIASWAELDLSGINTDIVDLGPDFDIDLLGIKDFEIEPADKYGDKDADHTPEVRSTDIKLGDLFRLGVHRLLCGDATIPEQVERLMNGEKADMVYTDPPYGMNLDTDYSSMGKKSHSFKKIENDHKPFDPSHIFELFGYVDEMFLFGADYYCERIPNKNDGSWIVWDKRESSRSDVLRLEVVSMDRMFGSCFELVWSKTRHKRDIARIFWCAGLGEGKDEERNKSNSSPIRFHPTQKPIELHKWFFERWAKDKTNIVDLYLGSGSTLLACEKTNRRCFGMEIDPQYCQVIIDRWEKFTGQKAVKI